MVYMPIADGERAAVEAAPLELERRLGELAIRAMDAEVERRALLVRCHTAGWSRSDYDRACHLALMAFRNYEQAKAVNGAP